MYDELELKRRLGELTELLFVDWDPIGVSDDPSAPRDEYRRYAGPLLSALKGGGSLAEIAARLDKIAAVEMGLDADAEANRAAAEKILAWYTEPAS